MKHGGILRFNAYLSFFSKDSFSHYQSAWVSRFGANWCDETLLLMRGIGILSAIKYYNLQESFDSYGGKNLM